MKTFVALLLLAVACTHAANIRYGRNMDNYKPRWTIYPAYVKMMEEAKANAPKVDGKIVGGDEATPNSWPHQVGLFIDNAYFCGGSIIDEEWILTAAHCVDGARTVDVVMGAHNIRDGSEATQVTMTSTDLKAHEQYSPSTIMNDIGIIKLPSSISITSAIKTVPLTNQKTTTLVGEMVTLTGWGKDSDSAGGISSVLREVTVPIQAYSKCSGVYGNLWNEDYLVCVDTAGGKGSCNGDSGGPMNKDGMTWGVTSFGSSLGCEEGYPSGYTSVSYFWDWIKDNTGVVHP
jgi:secreted trypsin-like serine protease